MGMMPQHIPVLSNEVLLYMCCRDGGVYVDATLGSGGHALNLLNSHPGVELLVGIDRDRAAIETATKTLEPFKHKTVLVHANFKDIREVLDEKGIKKIDGIIFDLGVSMSQIKDPERGFSFREKGALDMRMDRSASLTAKELIHTLSESELANLIREYGEERRAKKIARRIKEAQQKSAITTTTELAGIIETAVPAKQPHYRIHPATRTFQALRIAVNSELTSLRDALGETIGSVNPGGRICVISFHSLEDRIVKGVFRHWAKSCVCPRHIALCVCNKKSVARVITRKPVLPSSRETAANPSARSAKLRVAERI